VGNNRSNANVPAGWSQQDRRFGESIKQNLDVLQGQRGDKLDRAVTFRDLLDAGIVKLASGITNFNGLASSIAIVNEFPDLAIPPAPTNLQADGAFRNIILTWDLQLYKGHSAVQVWRHTSDVISSATMVAQVSGFTGVYADPVGSGKTFYYWVRAVNNNDVTGPYNSSTGVQGVTAPDVNFLLATLTNAVTSSELASSLSTPIALIPSHTSAIAALDAFTGYSSSYTGDSLVTRLGAVENSAANGVSSAQFNSEVTTRANADSALSQSITALTSTVAGNTAGISSEATTRANADSALSSSITTLSSTVNSNTSAISTEQTTRANADSALSSAISTVSSTVAGNTSSISTQATSINGLSGQYTVKIDLNGAVAGYGLASTTTASGNIVSEFIVNADRFAIMRGGSNITPASVPFIVQASATTINGVAVPAGVYMTDAFIRNGSIINAKIADAAIDNAKIANLSADKINAGTISTSRLNIDGSTLSSLNGVLQVNELNANKITAGTLSSSRLFLDGVTIDTDGSGRVIIKNLGVDTLQIKGNAVTVPSSAFTAAAVNSPTTAQSVSWTASGATVFIAASWTQNGSGNAGNYGGTVYLKYGGTTLWSQSFNGSNGQAVQRAANISFVPSAGTATITLESVGYDGTYTMSNRSLFALETKK